MIQATRKTLTKAARSLAGPTILFWVLPWLMVLLVLGTVAERYIGLYQSQKQFFGSFILWLGPLPLPGAYMTLGLIAASLMAKLLMSSPLKKGSAGVILTHVSALILLLGGLITATEREEGYLLLGPGDTSAEVADYDARTLVITRNGMPLVIVPAGRLYPGAEIGGNLPFTLRVVRYCYPCGAHARATPGTALRDAAVQVDIAPAATAKEADNHQAGAVLEVRGASAAADGTYVAFEGLVKPASLQLGQDHYEMTLKPQLRALPFSVKLLHFEKDDYPGTDMAKSYSSEVSVKDSTVEWSALIGMNAPLRTHGYTLYQSSYVEQDGKFYSVLAVVKNAGAAFPYIAIGLLCAGLVLHLALTFGQKRASK